MLTATMDHPPCDLDTPVRPSPLQARALHFLKKLALRARGSAKKSRDTISPVTTPSQDFQRAHSSLDFLRKPDISRLVGLRVEDGPNSMETDDSSQDVSASGNSPRLRPRSYSTCDSVRTAPMPSTFAGHGAAPLFFRDQAGIRNKFFDHESGNAFAPASLFLQSTMSLDAVVQPQQSPVSSPEHVSASTELRPDDQGVQDMPHNVVPRPPGNMLSRHDVLTTSLTEQALPTSSEPGIHPSILTPLGTEDSVSEAVYKRPPLLPHHSSPLPPPFRVTTERGLRLSPSIVTRQPIPLLNLPALPPPHPAPDTLPRRNVPLGSMPSLSRHGCSNAGCAPDHEEAATDDPDEEDCDDGDEEEEPSDALSVHLSDDEDDEPPSAGPSGTQGSKSLQKQRARGDASQIGSVSSQGNIGSDSTEPLSTSLAVYPLSPNVPNLEDIIRRTLDSDLSHPGGRLENKPSLYRVASRSMVHLGSTRRTERGVQRIKSRETVRRNAASGHTTENPVESEESETEAVIGRLLRRTSMPNFHPTSDPPPYPSFDPRPKEGHIIPHEDEGRERLPPYSNSLYLIATMPRKMEFTSPGVQAKDRKWRRVVCELEGTTFRVYKCPPGASGGGALGDWWERHVGVGDVASPNPPRARKQEGELGRSAKIEIDDLQMPVTPPAISGRSMSVASTRQRRGSQSSMATQHTTTSTRRQANRASGATLFSPFRSLSSAPADASAGEPLRPFESREFEILPVDVQESRSSLSREPSGRTTPVSLRLSQPPQLRSPSRLSLFSVSACRAPFRNNEIRKPAKSDLLRAYTLQHAESGLGNDYQKRKNVIRVRLEGEQFLLQAPDVPCVVEWIEGLHAGTNIALDIDERPMPRGPMFPRRRRRRRRTQGEDTRVV